MVPPVRNGLALAAALAGGMLAAAAHAAPMGSDEARHLLARTGFQPTPDEIAEFSRLEYAQAVDRILDSMTATAATPPPRWTSMSPLEFRGAVQAELRAARTGPTASDPSGDAAAGGEAALALAAVIRQQGGEAKAWWYREMLSTDSPFTERMVLFWHNHFTSSVRKVRYVPALMRQNALFRREAAGNFGRLLKAVARDPAMLIYLDGATSRAGRPNENFARELFELFTIGQGAYTESDIREAARAFTGWSLDRRTGEHRYYQMLHDHGSKRVLGSAGYLSGDDVIEIALRHPRTSERLVAKLWREFVSPDPDPGEVRRLARLFEESDHELKPLLRALLLSPAFRDPANRGVLIKSPVELTVGTLRLLRIPVDDTMRLVRAGRMLGQDLLDPPNVKGWIGGEAWISSHSLMQREQILQRIIQATQLVHGGDGSGMAVDREQLRDMPVEGRSMRTLPMAVQLPPALRGLDVPALRTALLALPPVEPVPNDADPGAAMARMMLDPVYQLK